MNMFDVVNGRHVVPYTLVRDGWMQTVRCIQC
jgi:hypothetical protein